jgi:hypothetical protein
MRSLGRYGKGRGLIPLDSNNPLHMTDFEAKLWQSSTLWPARRASTVFAACAAKT